MDDEPKLKFIEFAEYYLTNTFDYYIGGTTNKNETWNFKDYIPNDSGKWIIT